MKLVCEITSLYPAGKVSPGYWFLVPPNILDPRCFLILPSVIHDIEQIEIIECVTRITQVKLSGVYVHKYVHNRQARLCLQVITYITNC